MKNAFVSRRTKWTTRRRGTAVLTTTTKLLVVQYCIAAIWFTSAFSIKAPVSVSLSSLTQTTANKALPPIRSQNARGYSKREQQQQPQQQRHGRCGVRMRSSTREDVVAELSSSASNKDAGSDCENDEENLNDITDRKEAPTRTQGSSNSDEVVIALLELDAAASTSTPSDSLANANTNPDKDSSAARWNRRKQIAAGLVASILVVAGAAKMGWVPGPPLGAESTAAYGYSYGTYTDEMIGRDAIMTGLTSVLAVIMNRCITLGYERGAYDSKTGRKLTHTLSAPLFMVTWPFFSHAFGARIFAGLVCLTNMYRLYLAGTGDAAESSLANTISRSGDRSEVMGGPFIYVCLFQFFILTFWRNTFPGVVAMTTLAAGDGMADIVGRRFGKDGYKWPFSDGEKSLVGTAAFAVSAFVVTFAMCWWLIATGSLATSLTLGEMALRIGAISCICALVELLPFVDDNYSVPGSAAVLAALVLR